MRYYNKQLNLYFDNMKKRYYNSTTHEWYTEGQSMTRRVENNKLFSGVPSTEQLESWEFVEWVEPASTPEELLDEAKQLKIRLLIIYDTSDIINGFNINVNGITIENIWITPEQRSNYKNSIDSAELLGMDVVHPVFNGITFELSINTAKIYLAKILIYADRCFNTTETHKANINALTTIEEIDNYDYTVGYPEKLTFII